MKTRDLLEQACAQVDPDQPANFEKIFLSLGCAPRLAQTLDEYLQAACGRGFARELGVTVVAQLERPDGRGGRISIAGDPLWKAVEKFAEEIRASNRPVWAAAARQSAEVDTINSALQGGQTIDDLKGATVATTFVGVDEDLPGRLRPPLVQRLKKLLGLDL